MDIPRLEHELTVGLYWCEIDTPCITNLLMRIVLWKVSSYTEGLPLYKIDFCMIAYLDYTA